MSPRPVTPTSRPTLALRRARAAVVSVFFSAGFGLSAWVVHIPHVMKVTGLDDAGLGFLLLIMGAVSLAAMQIGGFAAARWGSRGLILVGAFVMLFGLVGAGLAPDPAWLGLALAGIGFGNGAVDMGMNDQAVRVERDYGRPIMSSMHAFFSVGGAVGAALSVPLLAMHLPGVVSLGIMGLLALAATVFALPWLIKGPQPLQTHDGDGTEPTAAASAPATAGPSVLRLGLILAIMAFSFFLAEGTVNDWSARHAVEHLGQSASTAAIAYVVFSVCMTIGRFSADRISGALGAVAVVRYGSLIAAAGMGIVVLAPGFPAALIGWALYGLGLSGIVPQLFTAAGSLVSGPRAAVVLSRVVGAGYVGLLAGPAVVGWLSGAIGLNQALVLPLVLCLAGTALSVTLGPTKRAAQRSSSSVNPE